MAVPVNKKTRVNKKSKKIKKEDDYVEKLEKEVRELKSINRSLLKQLKKISKGINKDKYEEALDEVENGPKKEAEDRRAECPECGRKGLTEIIIAGRRFQKCSICDYRSKRIG
jgi:formate dehydrogenase maturation protein FdhE